MKTKNTQELENYFSEWFTVIPKEEAMQLYKEKAIFILNPDGTDVALECYSWEEVEKMFPDALFGVEKEDKANDSMEGHTYEY